MQDAPESLPLRDIHLPESLPLWPPAPIVWILLGAILLAAAAALAYRYLRRRKGRSTLRQIGRKELEMISESLDQGENTQQILVQLSALTRRIARQRDPQSAGLCGQNWLEHLDAGSPERPFSHGDGRILLEGPYAEGAPDASELRALIALLEKWLERKETGAASC